MELLSELIFLIISAVIVGIIFKKLKMPIIIGYIVAGALFTNIVQLNTEQTQNINLLADIGITLLMFTLGIEFSLDKLLSVKKFAIGGGILQILLTILFGYLVFPIFGFSLYESFFLGSVMSFSSTAIVVKILEEKDLLNEYCSEITIGWLVLQDIAVVFLIILLSGLAPTNASGLNIIDSLLRSFVLIAGSLFIGRKLLPKILTTISKVGGKELVLISAFGFSLLFAFLATKLGVSSTLGAFLAGLMISESVLHQEIITEINPLQSIFSLIFFVSLGSLFSIAGFFHDFFLIISVLLLVVIVKIIIVLALNLILKLHFKTAFIIALNLAQVGEFAFLMAQIGLRNSWISSDVSNLISAVTLISMVISPILILNSDKIINFVSNIIKKYNGFLYRKLFLSHEVKSQSAKPLQNHIIVCGYGRVGRYVAMAIRKMRKKYIVIEMNKLDDLEDFQENVHYIVGDSTNIDILKKAGLERAKVLIITLPKEIDTGEIIRLAKGLNPEIEIIVRQHHSSKEIDESETFAVIEPEFEATVKMIEKLLYLIKDKDKSIITWIRKQKRSLQ